MIKRIVAIVLLVAGVLAVPSAAMAKPKNPDSVVKIDGRTFDAADGLVVQTGELPVGTAPAPGTVSAMSTYTPFYWGSSYVSSVHSLGWRYYGEAYAAANIYNGMRVIQTCFQYRRNGVNLTPWVCSSARSTGTAWYPGSVVNRMVYDTLDPYAPKTTFHYKTSTIYPGIY